MKTWSGSESVFLGRLGWGRFPRLSRRSLSFLQVVTQKRIWGCCQICSKPSAISHHKGLCSCNKIMIPSAALNDCFRLRHPAGTWWKRLDALTTPGTMCQRLLLPACVSKATWSRLMLCDSRRAPKKFRSEWTDATREKRCWKHEALAKNGNEINGIRFDIWGVCKGGRGGVIPGQV